MERVKDFFAGPVARVVRQSLGIEAYQMARDIGRSRRISLGYGVGEFVAPASFRVYRRQHLVTETSSDLRLLSFVRDTGQLTLTAFADVVGGVGGMRLVGTMLNISGPEDAMLNIAAQLGIKVFYNAAVHTVANLLHDAGRPNIGMHANRV